MISKTVVLKNDTGLHARPATLVIKEASKFQSNITFIKGTQESNAKSIMGLMAMGIKKGEEVEIKVDGPDEKETLDTIIALFESNFGE
ncbi:phosphocarrier protein [Anaerovirgula multivorans]|uniref:Phosphocarrier protein HPr n=1 Tax=Anaerovirgula multivorans TaxID=312168 RepID=A0A239D097_9FIRM|nr:HPr family phosphocarrier protein [Anaerovirgula multivorans]SNS25542.1 phosphocarrier protein [Anaerovirgula multivorans]